MDTRVLRNGRKAPALPTAAPFGLLPGLLLVLLLAVPSGVGAQTVDEIVNKVLNARGGFRHDRGSRRRRQSGLRAYKNGS